MSAGTYRPSSTTHPRSGTLVVGREYEGIVGKRVTSPYRPGDRGWVKVKNRDYWRYGQEVEAIKLKIERRRAFV
jgi:ATP-dependent DNA ligase